MNSSENQFEVQLLLQFRSQVQLGKVLKRYVRLDGLVRLVRLVKLKATGLRSEAGHFEL